MKRFVILAISFIALVSCFTSCGEKKLDPNFLPHNQQIKLSTNLDDMVSSENTFGQTTKKEDADDVEYQKDKISMAGIEWDYVAYWQNSDDSYPVVYYLKQNNFTNKDYDRIYKLLNSTYGPYQVNDFDELHGLDKKNSWVFKLDNKDEWRIILCLKDDSCEILLIGNVDSDNWQF